MKKADDYATVIRKNHTYETIAKVLNDFIVECNEIAVARKVKKDQAVLAIFREQDQKWLAVCRRVDGLNQQWFRLFVKNQLPEVASGLGWN